MNSNRWSVKTVRSLRRGLLREVIQESRDEGFAFIDRLTSEWRSGDNGFDKPGEALFALRDGTSSIAICGLNIDPYQADPCVARLRHLYVLRAARRSGVGRYLVHHALEYATAFGFAKVRLRTDTREAGEFYEALGFRRCQDAATATHQLTL